MLVPAPRELVASRSAAEYPHLKPTCPTTSLQWRRAGVFKAQRLCGQLLWVQSWVVARHASFAGADSANSSLQARLPPCVGRGSYKQRHRPCARRRPAPDVGWPLSAVHLWHSRTADRRLMQCCFSSRLLVFSEWQVSGKGR